ncbi:MAG: VWA domain-containing protein [Akkermansiaceae bacterium]
MSLHSTHHFLWVTPLIVLAALAVWHAMRTRRRTIEMLSGNAETCHLKTNASPKRRKILTVALFASLVFACIASLRPINGTTISEFERPAKNIIILLDVSKSMGASDVEGLTRMEAAKLLARAFVEKRPTDRIGLLSFSGAPYSEVPVTLTHTNLLQRIDKLAPGAIPVGGTDLGAAFKEARQLLTEDPPPGSAVIILSDGDNLTGSYNQTIESFAKADIPIIAVAFGSPTIPAPVPNSIYETQADYGALKEVADATGGIFLGGKPSDVDGQIKELSTRVDAIELSGEDVATEIFNRPLDIYAYPLTIALLLLLLHLFLPLKTKTWHPLSALIIFTFFNPQILDAQEVEKTEKTESIVNLAYLKALETAREEEKPLLLIFTGSDWSEFSIKFEEEILAHPIYRKWEKNTVVAIIIDLPRTGIDPDLRNQNRALASQFQVPSYPLAIFVDHETEKEIGRLTYDPNGPATWIKRADAVLSGDLSQGDSPASVDYLPKEIRDALENPSLTPAERSIGFYNKGLEIENAAPELAIRSSDRFKLLVDLYTNASAEAPRNRPDLAFAPAHKLGLLHHRRGRSLIPEDLKNMDPAEMMRLAEEAGGDPIKLLKKAQKDYRRALSQYQQAAPLQPGDENLTTNLAVVYRDLARVKAYLDYQEAYAKAVETTSQALAQEKRFRKSLEHEVTSRRSINDKGVERSAEAIRDLIKKGKAIKDEPTILDAEQFAEYSLAEEDINLAPGTHEERFLSPSVQHIQDALDHLIDPQQMQPQSGQGSGDPQDGDPSEGGEEEEESGAAEPQGDVPDEGEGEGEEDGGGEESTGDADADLRRSEKESGDLRDRLLERLGRENRRRLRGKDH